MSDDKLPDGITKMGHDNCPKCGHVLDAISSAGDKEFKPGPGDITICCYCTAILRFADDMALDEFSPLLMDTLSEEAQKHLLATIRVLIKVFPTESEKHDQLRYENVKKYFERLQ